MIPPFALGRIPRIFFGEGSLTQVPELAASFGGRALLVTGHRSFRESPGWGSLVDGLARRKITWQETNVEGEPSPDLVDEAVARFRPESIEVVVGIGGGSVLDAAKAIAGLLPHGNSVMDHLEGVGRGVPYVGPSVPILAVPTTAGTGSEATKNSVLSVRGRGGFKKSFRHECLMPEYAVVDPALLETCPPDLIGADGMDAVTQLIESYVSARANPVTDALAWAGLESARDGLWSWYERREEAAAGRAGMALAALLSGVTLAQTGLGAVHGIASPLGALHPVPHGVVCGTLLAGATRVNIRAMEEREPNNPALDRYARLGSLLTGRRDRDGRAARSALVDLLLAWTERLGLPGLSAYGVARADLPEVVAGSRGSSMKTNPIVLSDEEIHEILLERI